MYLVLIEHHQRGAKYRRDHCSECGTQVRGHSSQTPCHGYHVCRAWRGLISAEGLVAMAWTYLGGRDGGPHAAGLRRQGLSALAPLRVSRRKVAFEHCTKNGVCARGSGAGVAEPAGGARRRGR